MQFTDLEGIVSDMPTTQFMFRNILGERQLATRAVLVQLMRSLR